MWPFKVHPSLCVFSLLKQPAEQLPLKLRSIIKQHVTSTRNTYHHFTRRQQGLISKGLETYWGMNSEILEDTPVLHRTSVFSAEPWVYHHQAIKNVDSFGGSISTHNLLPRAPNSSHLSSWYNAPNCPLTFGGDVSPSNCRLWSTRRYAGEADIVSFINGDIWRNLYNFGRYCGDKTEWK